MKDNYTVLLLHQDRYGLQTHLAHVRSATIASAIKAAQKKAVNAWVSVDGKGVRQEDFKPLFVCRGEVEDERY